MFDLCFVMQYFVSFLVSSGEERGGCMAFIVLWMPCYCSLPLPHGAVC